MWEKRCLRVQIFQLIESADPPPAGRWIRAILFLLILLNIVAFVAESISPLASSYHAFFAAFELFSLVVFGVEYVARLFACVQDLRFREPVVGRLRWALTPLALIDLLAFLPGLLGVYVDLRVLRVLRLARVFRILKLARYSRAIADLGDAIRRTAPELIVVSLALIALLTLASSLLYWAERNAQPDAFASIPHAAWWGIATLTTVGYGDVYPVTVSGRLIASIVAVLGVGLFAVPSGVIASAFLERTRNPESCPHCGRQL